MNYPILSPYSHFKNINVLGGNLVCLFSLISLRQASCVCPFNKFSNNRKYFSCLINKSGQIVLNWQSEEIVNHYLPSTTLGWQLLSWGVKCNNCWNIYFLCSAPFFWLLMFFGWSKNNIQYLERTLATAAINTHTTHNLLLPASYENQ